MTDLATLMQAIEVAEAALLKELKRSFPIGAQITVRIREGVKTTKAEVIGHIGGREGSLRVRLEPDGYNIGRYANGYETTVSVRKVVP